MRFERLVETAALVRELSGYELAPWKPGTGENLFVRESGAVASQFHDPPAIEPFSAELVGADRRLVLGKKSGADSVRIRAEELGIELSDEERAAVLAEVKRLGAEKRGLVSDEEFRAIVERV
jgi:homocitrate synthase NifV